MTPVEKAVYNKYTDFLLAFDAKPEDMNKVVKHYYKKTYGMKPCNAEKVLMN